VWQFIKYLPLSLSLCFFYLYFEEKGKKEKREKLFNCSRVYSSQKCTSFIYFCSCKTYTCTHKILFIKIENVRKLLLKIIAAQVNIKKQSCLSFILFVFLFFLYFSFLFSLIPLICILPFSFMSKVCALTH
jgi:hypothetical protein